MARTLSEHAAYELAKAGMLDNEDAEARKAAIDTLALVKRFEKQDHSEKTAEFVLEAFGTLCSFLPITPITDDPEEWDKFEIDKTNVDTKEVEKKIVWQSKRASSIFSEDEGKTFTDQKTGKVGESVDHVKQAADVEAAKKARAERKAAAEKRANAPQPTSVLADKPANEMTAEGPKKPATTPEKEAK